MAQVLELRLTCCDSRWAKQICCVGDPDNRSASHKAISHMPMHGSRHMSRILHNPQHLRNCNRAASSACIPMGHGDTCQSPDASIKDLEGLDSISTPANCESVSRGGHTMDLGLNRLKNDSFCW
jgi:hypothetical protein